MARKKTARKKASKKTAKKSVAAKRKKKSGKKAAKKKAAAPKKVARTAVKKKKTSKKKTAKKKRAKSATKKKRVRKIKAKSLGRPRIPGDAKLDLLFQDDYNAREVCEFLSVQTLRELEAYSPDEIIEKLTGPMVQTVVRMRKKLAMVNRSLANDREFALEFKRQL